MAESNKQSIIMKANNVAIMKAISVSIINVMKWNSCQ